jgi:GH25 family lysozyme M1 (1,4-beta-N-acetylmuramidase)
MLDRDLQEWEEYEEYDSRVLDDTPFVRSTRESATGLQEEPGYSAEAFETPFLREHSAEERFEAEQWSGNDRMPGEAESVTEALEQTAELTPWRGDSFEVDPYAAIRPALAEEHASLPAEELTLVLGHVPASLVLHQLLQSPQMRHATLASILGRGARRTVRVNGADVSIPSYLRMVSRLCGEVAEQNEAHPVVAQALAVHPAQPHPARPHPAPPPAPPREVAGMPLGVDLYSRNTTDAVGFRNLKDRGKKFAIAKSSQGTTPDCLTPAACKFLQYYGWIRDAGMIRGSFHFFSNKHSTSPVFGGSVKSQADVVISLVKRLTPGDLAPALDLEDEPRHPVTGAALDAPKGGRYPLDQGLQKNGQGYNYRTTANGRTELLKDVQSFLDLVETALGRTPIIYTSKMWTDSDMLRDPKVMSQYPLWTVWHAGQLADISVGGWGNDWDFVQYAEQGGNWRGLKPYNEPGINIGGLDFDAYHWTIYGLRGLADIGRPAIAFSGSTQLIAQSDTDGSLHLLTGTPWQDHNVTLSASLLDLTGADPVMLTSLGNVFLYYGSGEHLIEATNTLPALSTWHTARIEAGQPPVHDPRAAADGTKRHVVYWGADNDWNLLTWDNGWTRFEQILTRAGIKTAADRGQASGQPVVYVSRGVVHIVGRAGSDGRLYDVWNTSSGWRKDDLTQLGRDLAPDMPPATYSPCAYETKSGVGIVFRAVRGNLWLIDRANNAPMNLTNSAHAKLAAGHPTCFVLKDEPHIVYRGSDKLIYDIFLQQGMWRVRQVCDGKTAADPVATSNGTTGMAAIRMMDGSIHVATFDGTAWTCSATN